MPDLGVLLLPVAGGVIAAAVYAIYRGLDVRLALLVAAFALAGLTGDVAPIVREFLATFSNEKFVVPICTAMGFAYVLRHTECDQHLVRLLTNPLRSARLFLIPGVVVVGFLVNIPVISQTSTAVCLGAVVVPLMRAARLSAVTIGASLLLGASIGGELLNPGAPELNTVGQRLGVSSTEVVPKVLPLVLPHLMLATLIFWLLCLRAERKAGDPLPPSPPASGGEGRGEGGQADSEQNARPDPASPNSPHPQPLSPGSGGRGEGGGSGSPLGGVPGSPPPEFRVNLVRALVPLLPLVLLFLAGPPLNVIKVPDGWLVARPFEHLPYLAGGAAAVLERKDPYYETRLIGAAMLVGVLAAALAHPAKIRGVPRAFFDGAGYAFAEVISLIVVASCFGKAVDQIGLAALIGHAIQEVPGLLLPVAGFVPLGFAALSGSGMAATQSLYGFFVDPATQLGADPKEVGAVVSVGAAAGRTMSPVAAVALMSAKLSGTNSFQLARRVALPLLVSLAAIIALRVLRVI